MRTTTTQLKHLFEALNSKEIADHPLLGMYVDMIRDAMLDLRDQIGESAQLRQVGKFQVNHIKHASEWAYKARYAKENELYNITHHLIMHLDEANSPERSLDLEHVGNHAIAPFTGDEE